MKIKKNLVIFPICFFVVTISCSDRITDPPEKEITSKPIVLKRTMVYEPSEGVLWNLGSIQKISWHIQENVEFVKIELFRKTEFKLIITEKYSNNGSFNWAIPEVLPKSVHYRIKISAFGKPDLFTTSEYFTIK